MFLECVIVCVGTGDFLAHTIIHNRSQFNKIVVVTAPSDIRTQRICEYYNVECVVTNVFYENGDVFNKGKGINEGLKRLSKTGWVIQLDADIICPPIMRTVLEKLPVDEQSIYGTDRFMCKSFEDWMDFLSFPDLTHSGWVFVNPAIDSFRLGYRISQYYGEGYLPIGFFQLWNPLGSKIVWYPTEHGAADRTDVLFAKQFEQKNRRFLPDFCVIHLESEEAQMGVNWRGRKTKPFTYKQSKEFQNDNLYVDKSYPII